IIKKKFPHDGFFGEETGEKASASGRRWIIDPLDGTRPYIYGLPFFSVLIALEENNKVVLGIIHLPALKETYYAVKGKGAFCNKKRIYVSKTKSLLKAHGAILGWNEMKDHRALSLLKLGSKVNYIFGFNDAYTYGCVACGKMDFSVNILDKAWDNASISIIIKEAGGEFSDLHGKASIYSNSTVVSNGLIHDELIQALH
ncbi:MAG: inositol monophosphatase, partial [Elusimicrobiota bacterium]